MGAGQGQRDIIVPAEKHSRDYPVMRKNKFQRNASKAREATERKRGKNATRRADDISQAVAQSRGISTEFSLTQIWLVAGSYDNGDLNSIEVGWQSYPQFYGDNRPRLFIFWTSDAYKSTGCYNLLCDGFVPTNDDAKIGEAITPTSSYDGAQYSVTIIVRKGDDGNWWLDIWREGDELITAGYWPATLFTTLSSYAIHPMLLEWTWEEKCSIVKPTSGSTQRAQMGSGHFSNEGYARASYISNIQIRSEPDGPYLNPGPIPSVFMRTTQIAMISSHLPTVKCGEFLSIMVGRATIPIVLEFLEFLEFLSTMVGRATIPIVVESLCLYDASFLLDRN
uniref:Neprosin PEP catalytic domain-containing protein n=1 Tax=Ananas comosus var. bracteatus TaxID=296719 RepID=A0A6V7QAB7_ANACO|nr:unnamed protein product [Ananas comosus var. bracteatus]